MLRHVLFDLSLFNDEQDRANSQKRVLALLQALTYCNQLYLRNNPETPLIYKSGIKYKVPQQFEKDDTSEVGVLRQYLERQGAPREVWQALHSVNGMVGGEKFRDISRIIENGGGDCFPLTQKVIVRSRATGTYEILSLGELRHAYSGYEALSYNFTSCKYEFKPILGFVDKGVKSVSVARLSNGTDLVATDDHKFWTLTGSKQNMQLEVKRMGEYVEVYTDFKKGRASKAARTNNSRILVASKIPALDAIRPSLAEAYLHGIYAAEGNFDGKHTCIAQHKPEVRQKIEASLAEVSTGFRYRQGSGATPGSGSYYALHGGASNPVIATMRDQGLNSFDKRFPRAMLSANEQVVSALLEGHGDGDAWRPANGSFKRPGVEAIYATSSDELADQLKLGLLVTGRPTYSYRYENHQGHGNRPIWRIHEYNRDASKLQNRVAAVGDELPGLTYATVRHAMPAGTAHVGCIEVEGNHNFILADGTVASNCDNVASWRAAELRELGIRAQPYITWRRRPDGGMTYHVIVRWPDGTAEDPSLLLGMGGAAKEQDRREEERKLAERMVDFIEGIKAKKYVETVFGEQDFDDDAFSVEVDGCE